MHYTLNRGALYTKQGCMAKKNQSLKVIMQQIHLETFLIIMNKNSKIFGYCWENFWNFRNFILFRSEILILIFKFRYICGFNVTDLRYSKLWILLGLKYQRFTQSGCKDKVNVEFVAKTQFLNNLQSNTNRSILKNSAQF